MATEVAQKAGRARAATAPVVPDVTREERRAAGKQARNQVPRESHAAWEPWSGRPDPVDLLEEQAAARVAELVPLRYGRMAISPFSFFRGAALQMAADLAHTPDSGLRVQACGSYRQAMRRFAEMGNLHVWYSMLTPTS